jgi:hypothetical protein
VRLSRLSKKVKRTEGLISQGKLKSFVLSTLAIIKNVTYITFLMILPLLPEIYKIFSSGWNWNFGAYQSLRKLWDETMMAEGKRWIAQEAIHRLEA